jgi:hypothetical protein
VGTELELLNSCPEYQRLYNSANIWWFLAKMHQFKKRD